MSKYIDAERFVEYFGDWYTEEGTENGFIGTIKDLVEQMPDIDNEIINDAHNEGYDVGYWAGCRDFEPQWIPVTERLPEVGSEVLVCYDFNGIRSVYISNFYGDGEFHGLDDEYLTNEGRRYRKAVAWMPLPEPYKGGEEE